VLIAQSGAVCSALLDFATPLGIGFSSVMALGSALDVDFGELLDVLLLDPETDGILCMSNRSGAPVASCRRCESPRIAGRRPEIRSSSRFAERRRIQMWCSALLRRAGAYEPIRNCFPRRDRHAQERVGSPW
jgi:hypothetical protein